MYLKKIISSLRQKPLPAIIALNVAAHWYVFFESRLLNAGDWLYIAPALLKKLIAYNLWTSHAGLGEAAVFGSNMVFYWTASILANISPLFSWDIFTRVFFLAPMVVLTPLFAYKLFYRVTSRMSVAAFAALLYSFNTFFLKLQLDWITYAAIWWLLPALLLSGLNYLDHRRTEYLVYNALAIALIMTYEIRLAILIIIFVAIFFLAYAAQQLGRTAALLVRSVALFASIAVGVALHLFWIIPFKQGLSTDVLSNASPAPFQSYYSLTDTLTLHYYAWSGNLALEPFLRQALDWRFYLVPAFALIGLIFYRKIITNKRNNLNIAFFALTLIVFAFLGKQAFAPLSNFYDWAFYNIPLFNLFRESSKFFIFVAMALSIFFGVGLVYAIGRLKLMIGEKAAWGIGLTVLFFTTIFNAQHYIDQKVGGMAEGVSIPTDYQRIGSFLSKDNNYYRVLWDPNRPRFAFYSDKHPFITLDQVVQNAFTRSGEINGPSTEWPAEQRFSYLLEKPYAEAYLKELAVRYIVIPISEYRDKKVDVNSSEIVDKVYSGNEPRSFYTKQLDEIPYLRRVNVASSSLAVYEVQGFKAPIYTITGSFVALSPSLDFDEAHKFVTNIIGKTYAFVRQKKEATTFSAATVASVFGNLTRSSWNGRDLKGSAPAQGRTSLYQDLNNVALSLNVNLNSISFFKSEDNPLLIDGTAVGSNASKTLLSRTTVNPLYKYWLRTDSQLLPLEARQGNQVLGKVRAPVSMLSEASANLIDNPSFESGPWSPAATSCDGYSKQIGTYVDTGDQSPDDGFKYLRLTPSIHAACTSTRVNVTPGNYALSFSFQAKGTKQVGYRISFEDSNQKPIEQTLAATSSGWQKMSRLVTVPEGSSSMAIELYGYRGTESNVKFETDYDNFDFVKLGQELSIQPKITGQSYNLISDQIENKTVAVTPTNITTSNLIKNPSFESGTWQQHVSDCNAYDSKPNVAMELDKKNKSDGAQSIALVAKRHTACTGPSRIDIKPNSAYLLSFDYQSSNSKSVSYSLKFNDGLKSTQKETPPVANAKWQEYNKAIRTPFGADRLELTIYTDGADDGVTEFINHYDNFRLVEIPDVADTYFSVNYPSGSSDIERSALSQPKSITFDLTSPTKKQVHIKGATTPFYLAMSEAYHPQWRLELNNARVHGLGAWLPTARPDAVAEANHFKLDDFLNGWYVDPAALCSGQVGGAAGSSSGGGLVSGCTKAADGSYNLELVAEFTPQRWFYVGGIISGATLLGCLGYLGWAWRRRWVRRRAEIEPAAAAKQKPAHPKGR